MYIINWKNSFTGDTGYVAHIKKDHFENTFKEEEARSYTSLASAEKSIAKIKSMPLEMNNNNEYTAIERVKR